MSNNIYNIYEKLYSIDKELGGTAKQVEKAKKTTEFDSIKILIAELCYKIKEKIYEREEKLKKLGRSDQGVISMGIEIRDNLNALENNLKEMNNILRRQAKNPKKYSKDDVAQRENIYLNLIQQNENLKAMERGVEPEDVKEKFKTITELKSDLLANRNNQNTDNSGFHLRIEANDEEKNALKQYSEKDKQIDYKAGLIADGLLDMKGKALQMGDKIDQTGFQIEKLTNEVDATNKTLVTSNQKLKNILKKYRQPNKFCLDVMLILFVLGLIAVIIKMLK